MRLNFLLPKQPAFFNLFIKQSQEILVIAKLLNNLPTIQNEFELKNFINQAKEIEHQADDLTHEIISRLNKTFVTPFDREDIYNLTEEFDDIIDKIENVIHNLEIYQVNPREKFIYEFSEIILKDAQYLVELTSMLKQQKYSESFKELIFKIHSLEDEGDALFMETLKNLFANSQDAIKIIKLKDILEDLERVVDKFQTASNTFESILVKSQ